MSLLRKYSRSYPGYLRTSWICLYIYYTIYDIIMPAETITTQFLWKKLWTQSTVVRFCTTVNKNWRDLTGNNFTDHVMNNCSDDSRRRDFIAVWEIQRPLRVLPTFEDGGLKFIWKKSEISCHKCNSKTGAKLKICVSFWNSSASLQ